MGTPAVVRIGKRLIYLTDQDGPQPRYDSEGRLIGYRPRANADRLGRFMDWVRDEVDFIKRLLRRHGASS